jgi:dCMP deaminase
MITKWDTRFMKIAMQVSTWSKDPSTRIGAVIVKDRRIISTGYNGFPEGIEDNARLDDRDIKYRYVIHAELNAILNAAKNGVQLEGSEIYVYGLPTCCDCAKAIIQSGIKKVFYTFPGDHELPEKWRESFEHSSAMYKETGVIFERI